MRSRSRTDRKAADGTGGTVFVQPGIAGSAAARRIRNRCHCPYGLADTPLPRSCFGSVWKGFGLSRFSIPHTLVAVSGALFCSLERTGNLAGTGWSSRLLHRNSVRMSLSAGNAHAALRPHRFRPMLPLPYRRNGKCGFISYLEGSRFGAGTIKQPEKCYLFSGSLSGIGLIV